MATDLTSVPLRNLKNMHKHAVDQHTHWKGETAENVSSLLLSKENMEHWQTELDGLVEELKSRGEWEEPEEEQDIAMALQELADEYDDGADENAEAELVHVSLKSENPPF